MTLHQRSFQVAQPQQAYAPQQMMAPAVFAASTLDLSGPMEVDINVYRGDTGRFRITVTEEDLSPVDISLADWDADIRQSAGSATVVATLTVEPVVGDESSVDVILTEAIADTLTAGNFVYDVEMRLDGEVITLIAGKFTVTQDVSRPT